MSWSLEGIGETGGGRAVRAPRPSIDQAVAEVVGLGDPVEIGVEREDLKNAREYGHAHAEIAGLQPPERGPRYEDARRHLRLTHAASEPGGLEALAERLSLALGPGKQGTRWSTHGTYY